MIVHLGVIVIAVALAASGAYVHQQELQLTEGATGTVAGHELTYVGMQTDERAEKTVTKALVRVDGGQVYAPAINLFSFSGQSIGTPSVRTTLTEDVMLSVLEFPANEGGPVLLRVTVQPLVIWLWIGGGIVAFGTVLAAFPGRRRRPTSPVSERVPGTNANSDPDPEPDPELVTA
jgi:cytochrome c-type biogenesis protein CcmF